jgi:hypothetical protein
LATTTAGRSGNERTILSIRVVGASTLRRIDNRSFQRWLSAIRECLLWKTLGSVLGTLKEHSAAVMAVAAHRRSSTEFLLPQMSPTSVPPIFNIVCVCQECLCIQFGREGVGRHCNRYFQFSENNHYWQNMGMYTDSRIFTILRNTGGAPSTPTTILGLPILDA